MEHHRCHIFSDEKLTGTAEFSRAYGREAPAGNVNNAGDEPPCVAARAKTHLDEAATYWALAQLLRTDSNRNLIVENPETHQRVVIASINFSEPRDMPLIETQLRSARACVRESRGRRFKIWIAKEQLIDILENTSRYLAALAAPDLEEEAAASGKLYQPTAWLIRYHRFDRCGNCGQAGHVAGRCPIPFPGVRVRGCLICNARGHEVTNCPDRATGPAIAGSSGLYLTYWSTVLAHDIAHWTTRLRDYDSDRILWI